MKRDNLIDKWLDHETSAEEREEMEKIIDLTSQMDVPESRNKDMAWDQFVESIDTAENQEHFILPAATKKPNWFLRVAGIAAVLTIGYFSLFLASSGNTVSFETAAAEIKVQTLPDLSEVTLNANSQLSYNKSNWNTERNLDLSGEAFFEVTKGNTFTVNTSLGKVTVLGTSFNVFNRNDDLIVSCVSGSVSVTTSKNQTVLKPGERARFDAPSDTLIKEGFNLQLAATWRVGEFYFDGIALTEVIDELERQFNIKIEVKEDLSDRFYTGFFSTKSLSEALQLVFVPMGLSSQVNDNIVTIE